jgi:transcription elongation factor Elf1
MTAAAVLRHSAKCPRCEMKLISPEWSETLAENETINFWCCPICGHQFETTDNIVEPEPSETELAEEFLPELLVA